MLCGINLDVSGLCPCACLSFSVSVCLSLFAGVSLGPQRLWPARARYSLYALLLLHCQRHFFLRPQLSLDTHAAGLATLINRMNKSEMTIAVDGSLYRFHPRFHNLMCLKIQELVQPGLKVSDSSIIIIKIAVSK